MQPKSKYDRVKEALYLLKQIKDQGIQKDHEGYATLKGYLDRWIEDGLAFKGRVDFPMHSRRGELMLPAIATASAGLHLKHHAFE